jgi:MoaA/NifB/PqqE/SkfB family radical SAM enzyme
MTCAEPGPLELSLLYRGPLASCNYDCPYCPFAKRVDPPAALAADRAALVRFLDWVESRAGDRLSILFTPWGEALIRKAYQEAMVRLSRLPQVAKVAIQTNLSCRLDWVARCDLASLGLWCTYHPGQVAREDFLARCRQLDRMGARYSVGVVGLREHFEEIERLRGELASGVYLWVNAYKREAAYYTEADVRRLEAVDPLFAWNNRRHPSQGRACRTGSTVVSVDGDGTVRRCHFVPEVIGNLYEPGFERALAPRSCTNATCGCHIGYVNMDELDLYGVFGGIGGVGGGVLERIPAG